MRTGQVPVILTPKPDPSQHSVPGFFWLPCRVHYKSKILISVTKIDAKLPWFYDFIFRVYGLYVMVKETFAWKQILFKLLWIWVLSLVAAGSPVFLFPALLDHVMSFVVVRSYSMYQLERFTRSNDVFNAWQRIYPCLYGLLGLVRRIYTLGCTDRFVSSK